VTLSPHLFLVPKNKEISLCIFKRRLKFLIITFDFSVKTACLACIVILTYVPYIKCIACLHMHFNHCKDSNRLLPY